ncbi:MAG: radical SAM family heme chaperone HemW [Clostridia bacterium]|nr:radical SAM family heme chaperone HemW [Clostridia bacterium]
MSAGLYFHIPFCARKCDYCDFYSFTPTDGRMDAYRDALIRSIDRFAPAVTAPFDTVYFGGGTPSFFGGARIRAVLDAARAALPLAPGAEITVECNPSSTTEALAASLAAAGVNRVSLGLQSAVAAERAALGRTSTPQQAETALQRLRRNGITNLSLDLMLGLPGQTAATLRESLRFVSESGVPHVSAYLLKVEENTPLFAKKETLPLPDEDSVCDFYLQTAEALEQGGLRQYEISNFARPGFESRHNLHYWRDEAYLGLGPAAHSFFGGKRFFFPRDFDAFLRGDPPVQDGDGGDPEEFCMLRLRLAEGLSDGAFRERFGKHLPEGMFRKAKVLETHGLLRVTQDTIALTKRGFLVSNAIIGELVAVL